MYFSKFVWPGRFFRCGPLFAVVICCMLFCYIYICFHLVAGFGGCLSFCFCCTCLFYKNVGLNFLWKIMNIKKKIKKIRGFEMCGGDS